MPGRESIDAAAKAAAEAHARWQAAEDQIGGEIKYIVGLVGGDPSNATPTLRAASPS